MSGINDGGAAFPIPLDDRPGAYAAEPGMSIRDYFAAKALVALIAEPPWNPGGRNTALVHILVDCNGAISDEDAYATASYKLADAMLRAREAK